MVVCANCSNEALYTYQISVDIKHNYCDTCLPKFLLFKRDAGQIPLQVPVVETVEEEVPAKTSKKKVAEEPVAETVVVEETTTEEVVDSVTE